MSERSAESQLSEVERETVSLYVAQSRLPRWYLPFMGSSMALMLASLDLEHRFLTILIVLTYVGAIGYVHQTLDASRGLVPRFRGMPGRLLRPILVYIGIVALALAVGSYLAVTTGIDRGFTIVGLVVGLLMWIGGWITYQIFAARAHRLADAARRRAPS